MHPGPSSLVKNGSYVNKKWGLNIEIGGICSNAPRLLHLCKHNTDFIVRGQRGSDDLSPFLKSNSCIPVRQYTAPQTLNMSCSLWNKTQTMLEYSYQWSLAVKKILLHRTAFWTNTCGTWLDTFLEVLSFLQNGRITNVVAKRRRK